MSFYYYFYLNIHIFPNALQQQSPSYVLHYELDGDMISVKQYDRGWGLDGTKQDCDTSN